MSSSPRQRPPPLRLSRSPLRSRPSSTSVDNQFLYDLPSASSITSPFEGEMLPRPSPSPSSRSPSATRIHPANRASRALSPPSHSPKGRLSPSPNPVDENLKDFAMKCRDWYFDQNEEAGRQMTQTMASIQPLARATYARAQAQIRALYHTYIAARRKAEFRAHLSSTIPGGSLPPQLRSDPCCSNAKAERRARFDRFVKAWCNTSMPGTRPFFESLWIAMRLQVVPLGLGGAGSKRLCWEFDDAVFMESAGKEFMLEAIDALKGVLGLHEVSQSRSSRERNSSDTSTSLRHSRSRSAPLHSLLVPDVQSNPRSHSPRPLSKRGRAPSDPFLDAHTSTSPISKFPHSSHYDDRSGSRRDEAHANPLTKDEIDNLLAHSTSGTHATTPSLISESTEDGDFHRVWTLPDLSNSEYLSLISVFPSFLTRRTLPRFPVISGRVPDRNRDLESSGGAVVDRETLRIATGRLWIGAQVRSGAWQGSWWDRFKAWWRRMFR